VKLNCLARKWTRYRWSHVLRPFLVSNNSFANTDLAMGNGQVGRSPESVRPAFSALPISVRFYLPVAHDSWLRGCWQRRDDAKQTKRAAGFQTGGLTTPTSEKATGYC
jgi:hypothetical protein